MVLDCAKLNFLPRTRDRYEFFWLNRDQLTFQKIQNISCFKKVDVILKKGSIRRG